MDQLSVADAPPEGTIPTLTVLGTIQILGIRAIGCHGYLPGEQSRGQPFEVDVRLDVDLSSAAVSDDPDDTVDHAVVAEAVVRTVELTSYRLLERLTDRIARSCISLTAVTSAEVTVRKLRLSTPVHVASLGVTIRRRVPSRHAPCPVCGIDVSGPVPAGAGPNRWICPACVEPLRYSVSRGELTKIKTERRPPTSTPATGTSCEEAAGLVADDLMSLQLWAAENEVPANDLIHLADQGHLLLVVEDGCICLDPRAATTAWAEHGDRMLERRRVKPGRLGSGPPQDGT